jgi:hypothetical protein
MLGLKGASARFLSLVTVLVMMVLVVLSIYAGRQFARKEKEEPAKV